MLVVVVVAADVGFVAAVDVVVGVVLFVVTGDWYCVPNSLRLLCA